MRIPLCAGLLAVLVVLLSPGPAWSTDVLDAGGRVSSESSSAGNASAAGLLAGILVLAFLFAQVEIQVEGAHGWAGNLPTWRIENHPACRILLGGKALTGYHFWVFLFMAAVFHLPLALIGTFTPVLEARVLGSVMVFWIAEDYLWFLMNPAFGVRRFKREFIPWHKHWLGWVPVDYLVFLSAGAMLLGYSYMGGR